jgi:hypothetical protein
MLAHVWFFLECSRMSGLKFSFDFTLHVLSSRFRAEHHRLELDHVGLPIICQLRTSVLVEQCKVNKSDKLQHVTTRPK